jgi:outer membrane protein assembly factor BamB
LDTGGRILWHASTGAPIYRASPVLFQGVVYIGSTNGSFFAFDAITGQQRWSFSTNGRIISSPVVD